MKIVILQGSPNLDGSTAMLVDSFTKGASENGHEVIRFDLDRMNINTCTGCVACGYEGPCAQNDDYQKIRETLLASGMVVFATPLYYFGMSAQLKTAVDRFCAYSVSMNRANIRSALLTVAWNTENWTFDALVSHYNTLVRYCNFKDQGMVLGYGCGTAGMTGRSKYIKQAYELGKNIK